MLHIKDIFRASVCSFCKNIYEYNSIDTDEFIEILKSFLRKDNLQKCLEVCTSEVIYDINNIENICDNLYFSDYKKFDERNVVDLCTNAYIRTLEKDKTINIEAFVDNLAKEFSK